MPTAQLPHAKMPGFRPAEFIWLPEFLSGAHFSQVVFLKDFRENQKGRLYPGLSGTIVTDFHRLTSSDINRQLERAERSIFGRLQGCKKFVITLFYFISDYRCHLMTGWFSPFLFYLASCTENELRRQVELYRAQVEMLRCRVINQRIFLKAEEKERLLKLGAELGPNAHKSIVLVHPRIYQRWVREKKLGKKPKKMRRPRTLESIRETIVRLARETGWGYNRILGELKKLRIRCVSQSTIKNILKEECIKPSPKRGPGTWDEFLIIHVETLWQVDFFSKMIWTPTRLR